MTTTKTVYCRLNLSGGLFLENHFHDRPAFYYCWHVQNVPSEISDLDVLEKMRSVALWHADGLAREDDAAWIIDWAQIKDAQPGAIVKAGAKFTVWVYEHWSTCSWAVITDVGAVPGDLFKPLGNFTTKEAAKEAAFEWLMASEKRLGWQEQEPEPVAYRPHSITVRVHGSWKR